MKVVWGRRARRDLNELISYLAEDSPSAAELVLDRIRHAAQRVGSNPRCGRRGRVKGTRELVVQKTSHILAYRILPSEVFILRLLHGARRWPAGLD